MDKYKKARGWRYPVIIFCTQKYQSNSEFEENSSGVLVLCYL
jgi:hypothetical protein